MIRLARQAGITTDSLKIYKGIYFTQKKVSLL